MPRTAAPLYVMHNRITARYLRPSQVSGSALDRAALYSSTRQMARMRNCVCACLRPHINGTGKWHKLKCLPGLSQGPGRRCAPPRWRRTGRGGRARAMRGRGWADARCVMGLCVTAGPQRWGGEGGKGLQGTVERCPPPPRVRRGTTPDPSLSMVRGAVAKREKLQRPRNRANWR